MSWVRAAAAAHLGVGEGIESPQREQEQGGQFPGDHIDGGGDEMREEERGGTDERGLTVRLWGGAAPSSTQLA